MFLTLLFCLFKALCDCERYFIHKGGKKRNEGEKRGIKGKGSNNDAERIPWFQMRYSEIVKGNRDPGTNITAVQKGAGNHSAR